MTSRLNKDLILIRVDKAEEQTASGVYVIEEWQSRPPMGVVEGVADNVTFVKVGDRVFFDRYGSLQSPFDGDLRVCRVDGIFQVVDEG